MDKFNKFPPDVRLNSKSDIELIFKNSKAYRSKHTTILLRKNDKGFCRLLAITSKKNVGNAVSRNRVKRIIRESFRNIQTELNAEYDFDIAVLAKRGVSGLTNKDLFEHLEYQWKKIIRFGLK